MSSFQQSGEKISLKRLYFNAERNRQGRIAYSENKKSFNRKSFAETNEKLMMTNSETRISIATPNSRIHVFAPVPRSTRFRFAYKIERNTDNQDHVTEKQNIAMAFGCKIPKVIGFLARSSSRTMTTFDNACHG